MAVDTDGGEGLTKSVIFIFTDHFVAFTCRNRQLYCRRKCVVERLYPTVLNALNLSYDTVHGVVSCYCTVSFVIWLDYLLTVEEYV